MSTPTDRADWLHILSERGFIQDVSNRTALERLARESPIVGYIGFDGSADSLHAGSLLPIMMLAWMQRCGHRPIVLMGGGTSLVGDPSGKDSSRPLLNREAIDTNIASLRRVFDRFLDFSPAGGAVLANNADWLCELSCLDFLRDCGRHFSINRMLGFDSVRLRLERRHSLSFLEFTYMVLQACDFLELWRRYGCRLQMGGSDQWGNIVSGIDLIRRKDGPEAFGLVSPLLTTASGGKMGKTADGAVWLNADRLSPYAYRQYWRNVADADIGRFLRLFTFLDMGEIRRLEALRGAETSAAKEVLADHATRLCHGDEAANRARQTARDVFGQGLAGADLPQYACTAEDLEIGVGLLTVMVHLGLATSNSAARRLINQGGVRINDTAVSDPGRLLRIADLGSDGIRIAAGRKRHGVVRCHRQRINAPEPADR